MKAQGPITSALIAHFKTLPFSPEIDLVDSPEDSYQPTIGREYLLAQIMINETETFPVSNGTYRYTGIFQVTVVYPRNAGILLAIDLADEVVDHFEKGTIIDGDGVRVKINRQPSQATPIGDDVWLRLPVSIPYQCMA